MSKLKEFGEFVEKGVVRKGFPDKPRANDLVEGARRKNKSLKIILDKIGLNDENANDILEYCYDIAINFVRAQMLGKGFNSSGRGAHEAEVSYLRELNFSEADVQFMNQLRYFRNGIMYYGKRFDKEYAEKVLDFLERFMGKLK